MSLILAITIWIFNWSADLYVDKVGPSVSKHFTTFKSLFLISVLLFVCRDRVSLRSPGWSDTHCVNQDGLKLVAILCPRSTKCCAYRHVILCNFCVLLSPVSSLYSKRLRPSLSLFLSLPLSPLLHSHLSLSLPSPVCVPHACIFMCVSVGMCALLQCVVWRTEENLECWVSPSILFGLFWFTFACTRLAGMWTTQDSPGSTSHLTVGMLGA